MRKIRNILVIRNDGIGDFVLTLPAIRLLKEHYPQARITLLARDPIRPLAVKETCVDNFLPDRDQKTAHLVELFRKGRFDLSVHFITRHPTLSGSRRPLLAAYRAGIETRLGPVVHPLDWLLLNRRRRQHRSRALKNEACYNLELLQELGIPTRMTSGKIQVPPGLIERTNELIRQIGIRRNFIVIHPGMKGSALNLAPAFYRRLMDLLKPKYNIVVSLGPDDTRQREHFPKDETTFIPDIPMRLDEYLGLIKRASFFIGPSTGPTHLAAAAGVPTIGLYSPVRVHSPARWGFYETESAVMLTPPVVCGQIKHCLFKKCAYHPCMEKIEPETVVAAVHNLRRRSLHG